MPFLTDSFPEHKRQSPESPVGLAIATGVISLPVMALNGHRLKRGNGLVMWQLSGFWGGERVCNEEDGACGVRPHTGHGVTLARWSHRTALI